MFLFASIAVGLLNMSVIRFVFPFLSFFLSYPMCVLDFFSTSILSGCIILPLVIPQGRFIFVFYMVVLGEPLEIFFGFSWDFDRVLFFMKSFFFLVGTTKGGVQYPHELIRYLCTMCFITFMDSSLALRQIKFTNQYTIDALA